MRRDWFGHHGAVALPLPTAEIARLADSVRSVLDDADVALSPATRHRYEGLLVALELVLGREQSVLAPDLDLLL
jgi:hypothetical protein